MVQDAGDARKRDKGGEELEEEEKGLLYLDERWLGWNRGARTIGNGMKTGMSRYTGSR